MGMSGGSLDELIARCVRELEAQGLAVPGAPGVEGASPTRRVRRFPVPVGVSARHVHLCEADFVALFGPEKARAGLSKLRDLSQPGQFAANEVVSLVGPRGSLGPVRVLGPLRARTQVEVSRTDARVLGVAPPTRESGDLDGSAPIALIGPAGLVSLKEGAIVAARHIHMAPADARECGVSDKDRVEVAVGGERALVFRGVIVRVDERFRLEMHVDTDEANASQLSDGDVAEIVVDER